MIRSGIGIAGGATLLILVVLCVATLPWTLSSPGLDREGRPRPARYKDGTLTGVLLPPTLIGEASMDEGERDRYRAVAAERARERAFDELRLRAPPGRPQPLLFEDTPRPSAEQIEAARPFFPLGTDKLGRDVLVRCLAGGGVSIGIGIVAASMSVVIGTLYGALSGYVGGRTDAVLMRIVDILYGLPYLLLVVLLALAGDALLQGAVKRDSDAARARRDGWLVARVEEAAAARGLQPTPDAARKLLATDADLVGALNAAANLRPELKYSELPEGRRALYDVSILLVAIGGVSWLTMARVIRGQVLSLKAQPFMEAARAIGVPVHRQFLRHLLPNLLGPIIVYATLTVPTAILEESFLSFLGIGVRPPLPSWGNLASEGLVELNSVRVRWWLILFPCLLLGITLVALNLMGEWLRESYDPKRARA